MKVAWFKSLARRERYRLPTVLAGLLAAAVACGKLPPTSPTILPPEASWTMGPIVTIGGTVRGVMIPGDSVQLSATYSPRDRVTNPRDRTSDATWASSNAAVLGVTSGGLATAYGPGVVTVTATVDGVAGSVVISIASSRLEFSGRLDPSVAVDLITFNQDAAGNPRKGVITRWELPVPVFIDPSMGTERRPCVVGALDAWKARAGLDYVLLDADTPPRLRVFCAWVPDNRGRAHIESTNPDNSARLTYVLIGDRWPNSCSDHTIRDYVHEIGHAIGIWGHIPDSITGSPMAAQMSEREIRFLTELYRLPHGAHIEPDGSWSR